MGEQAAFLATVGAVYFVLAASPGPNFLLVTHAAASQSRRIAFLMCLGVSTASVFWAALAAAGLGLALQRMGTAYRVLQVAGGIYLLYLAWTMVRRPRPRPASATTEPAQAPTAWQAYRRGLVSNLGNPKSLAFFGSAFASLFHAEQSLALQMAAVAVVGCISIGWQVLVVLVFSTPALRHAYQRAKRVIDRVAGVLLAVFGARMILGR
jgi:threonine efflux protein